MRKYIPVGFQGAGKASAPVSSGAYIEVGEQRNQADNTVQTLKGDGYIPIRFQDAWASAPLIRGAPPCMKIGDIGEQRSQADHAVQNRILKDNGYIFISTTLCRSPYS